MPGPVTSKKFRFPIFQYPLVAANTYGLLPTTRNAISPFVFHLDLHPPLDNIEKKKYFNQRWLKPNLIIYEAGIFPSPVASFVPLNHHGH